MDKIKKYRIALIIQSIAMIALLCFSVLLFFKGRVNEDTLSKASKAQVSGSQNIGSVPEEIVPLEDEAGAWYSSLHFISHSGGGIDGKLYSDSMEAWEHSYEEGNRIIDADLNTTSDGHLVLAHSFKDNLEKNGTRLDPADAEMNYFHLLQYKLPESNIPDHKTFMSEPVYRKYTPMDVEAMLDFMAEHEDLYVVCDMKKDTEEGYRKLVETAENTGCSDVLSRVIVAFYDDKDFEKIKKVYPFEHYMIRRYGSRYDDPAGLVEFCVKNDIHCVGIQGDHIDNGFAGLLNKYNIHIAVAVVEHISDMQYYHDMGVDMAVTDWLYESDWKYVEEGK